MDPKAQVNASVHDGTTWLPHMNWKVTDIFSSRLCHFLRRDRSTGHIVNKKSLLFPFVILVVYRRLLPPPKMKCWFLHVTAQLWPAVLARSPYSMSVYSLVTPRSLMIVERYCIESLLRLRTRLILSPVWGGSTVVDLIVLGAGDSVDGSVGWSVCAGMV